MKVSVIIPLYNAEKYIAECIDSVIQQTYRDIEIIVVDDGSSDKSLQIVQDIAKDDERIVIYSQKNSGASVARNVGLKHATGQYVQFLDSDDILDANKIQYQIQLLERIGFPPDVIAISQWSILGTPIFNMPVRQKCIWHDYDSPVDLLLEFAIIGCCLPPLCYLVPKDLIDVSGGWDETLTLNDDGEFFARIIQRTKQILYSDKAVAYYRSTPNSLSKTLGPTYADSWVRSLISVSEIVRESQKVKSEEAVCKMISSCLFHLYPYYSKARKKGEDYLRNVYPHYVVKYPKLNLKEKLYYVIQSVKNADLK